MRDDFLYVEFESLEKALDRSHELYLGPGPQTQFRWGCYEHPLDGTAIMAVDEGAQDTLTTPEKSRASNITEARVEEYRSADRLGS